VIRYGARTITTSSGGTVTHRPAAAALLVVAALLTGCSSTMTPDPNTQPPATPTTKAGADKASCEKAMRAQLARATDPAAPSGTRPPECAGVSDGDLQEIAMRLLSDAPTPSAT
jgi:PBP1b-binding outer membrane lipoprotein LpoB